jgi:pimeloyl-ACP methyl ester carboxylesterase
MLTTDEEQKVHYLQLDNAIEIAYLDEGEGRPLVFVHGLASDFQVWRKNIPLLALHYRCIALDLPAYGQSSKGDYPISMAFFAEAVAAFIRKLALEDVVLVGHSMGGQVSIQLLLDGLVPISKLILTATAGFEQFTKLETQWFRTVMTPALLKAATIDQIEQNIRLNFHHFPDDAEFMVAQRLALMDDQSAYEYYCGLIPRSVLSMVENPVFDRLKEITIPTLIIYGIEDVLIPNRILHPGLSTVEVARAGHEEIEDSQLFFLTDAGHFVQYEQAEEYNARVQQFVGIAPEHKEAEDIIHGMFAALSAKDFPALLQHFASSSRIESTLWGRLEGDNLSHYLEILMDATIEVALPSSLQQMDEQHWQLDWVWKGIDPLNNKLVEIDIQSTFDFTDEKIKHQLDEYSLWTWLSQARGTMGQMWGWLPWWQQNTQKAHRKYLEHFGS